MDRRNHPPLVDATSCLCRADVGVRTTFGAKNVVSGSKLCRHSSIKPSIHPVRQKPSSSDRNRSQLPLIPGLPNDLALSCLIRVPRTEHWKLRVVCKSWFRLLAGSYFYSLRKNLGIMEEWIYVFKRDRNGRVSWGALDPMSQIWQPLPPVPREYSDVLGFGCAVLSGCHLYLFGGKDPHKGSMRRVIFYNARTNKWHRAPDMLRRRHCFASCVINNCLFVAGGESEGTNRYLKSSEMYDPIKKRWAFISEMSNAMTPLNCVVYNGRWYLRGIGSHGQLLSEVYVPEVNSWQSIFNSMAVGWRNPSICLNGQLFTLDCKDGCKMKVYNEQADSWSNHIDSKMHLGNSHALEAAALVPLNGKLCIIRNNLSVSLVDVTKYDGPNVDECWENVVGNGQLRTFITNLWSHIAGSSRPKHHIISCQVLQA